MRDPSDKALRRALRDTLGESGWIKPAVFSFVSAAGGLLFLRRFMGAETMKEEAWLWLLGVGGVLPAVCSNRRLSLAITHQ
jgi:hypothetical protein